MIAGDLSKVRMIKDATAAGASAVPRTGSAPSRQRHGGRATWGGYVPPTACGSMTETGATLQNCGWPYWSMLLWGHEPVYRLIRNVPAVALVRYIVTGPVRASAWDTTWTDGVERSRDKRKTDDGDPAIRFLKEEILPLRRKVMRDAIRCFDYGWQPFVVKWEIRNGLYIPTVEPVLPDATVVLKDKNRFAGIENHGEKGPADKFNDLESWVPSLDGEAGYPYGRSRYENVRDTAWPSWLNAALRLEELHRKVSGIIPMVFTAPNGYKDDENNTVNYADEGMTVLEELPRGKGVRLIGLFDPQEILDKAPESAAKNFLDYTPIRVQFLDAGNVAQAIPGFVQTLEYWDKQLFRGCLRPERTGLEAVAAGSRADSEQHTETGAADSETIDADITESFDENVVRTALRLNFGEEKARRIHVISTPLMRWKQQVFREMLTRIVSIPELAIDMAKALDVDAMLSQMSLPQVEDFVVSAVLNPPPPGDGAPKANGNGNGDEGKTRAAAEQLATLLHERFSKLITQ